MIIRPFEKRDLVWLRPMAEKYGSWDDCQAIAKDPDGYGLIIAMVVAPYCVGIICHDQHGPVLEGLCEDYGIKQLIRLGDFIVRLADDAGIDLHNHKWNEKRWYQKVLTRWGFEQTIPEVGHIRYAMKASQQEVG